MLVEKRDCCAVGCVAVSDVVGLKDGSRLEVRLFEVTPRGREQECRVALKINGELVVSVPLSDDGLRAVEAMFDRDLYVVTGILKLIATLMLRWHEAKAQQSIGCYNRM